MDLVVRLKRFAEHEGFTLKEDPFHASTGCEFQCKIPTGIFCVGYILGPLESVLYTRLIHNKVTKTYRVVRKIKMSDFNYDSITKNILVLMKKQIRDGCSAHHPQLARKHRILGQPRRYGFLTPKGLPRD